MEMVVGLIKWESNDTFLNTYMCELLTMLSKCSIPCFRKIVIIGFRAKRTYMLSRYNNINNNSAVDIKSIDKPEITAEDIKAAQSKLHNWKCPGPKEL